MQVLSAWFTAFRPRTLILVVSGTIAAISVAVPHGVNAITTVLVLLTALSLQILSNLANDYGDSIHGADNEERIGPKRSVQGGYITQAAMKRAMIFASLISAICGGLLLVYTYRMVGPLYFSAFLAVGALAIWAAIAYTATDKPYGYSGLGDVMVFLFFGLVMVGGGSWLIANRFGVDGLILGVGFGFIATAVLNVNNLRDLENDKTVGKITIAVRLGPRNTKMYQAVLLLGAMAVFVTYSLVFANAQLVWVWLLFLLAVGAHLKALFGASAASLDKFIPQLAILSLAAALTFLVQSML